MINLLKSNMISASDVEWRMFNAVPVALLAVSSDLVVLSANQIFCETFGFHPNEIIGNNIRSIGNGQWDTPEIIEFINSTIRDGKKNESLEITRCFTNTGEKSIILSGNREWSEQGSDYVALLSVRDCTDYREQEKQLKITKQKYSAILDSIYDGFMVVNAEGRIEYSNQELEKMFGYTPGELFQQNYDKLILNKDKINHRSKHDNYIKNPVKREMGKGLDLKACRKDGSEFLVDVSLSPIKIGSETLVACIIRDISEERRLYEASIRESKNIKLFEAIAASANNAKNPEQGLREVLRHISMHMGWNLGHAFILKDNKLGGFISSKIWYVDEPQKYLEFIKYSEELKLFDDRSLPGRVAKKKNTAIIPNILDDKFFIRKDVAVKLGLKSAFAFPVSIGDTVVAVLEFFSKDMKIPEKAATDIVGYVVPQLGRVFERKLLDDQNAKSLLLAEKARQEAEIANRVKDDFLATLSHELRTPLTTILAWAQILQLGRVDAEKLKHGLSVIEQNSTAQGQLIDDLLDVSRIRAGKLILNFGEIDLSEVVLLSIGTVQCLADKKSIKIESKLNTKITRKIVADKSRVHQVFWNILTNAIKFTPNNGKILVILDQIINKSGEFLSVQFIDSGIGIKREFLPSIFNRFSQADSSTTRNFGGLGLGMSIVQSLVHMQNGEVVADSKGEGKGSTFTVTFPSYEAKNLTNGNVQLLRGVAKRSDKLRLDTLNNLKVLIVDDEADAREAISIMLASFGATVIVASSASEGLNKLTDLKPDILISDIAMPREDGYSLIRKVRSLESKNNSQHLPALALTAYAGAEEIKQMIECGFNAHMAKPVDARSLSTTIAKLAKSTKNA